jgi:transposase InsO family protein
MTRRRKALSPAVVAAIADRALGKKVDVAALCRTEGISTSWFYALVRRFGQGGLEALEPRSTAPHHRPSTTSTEVVEAMVRARKQLHEQGSDNGPFFIRQRLIELGIDPVPSESTIYRHLRDRGQILAQPHKRPRTVRRFEYPAPNSCWQIDGTHVHLANGTRVTVIEIIDDHSRIAIASHAASNEAFESAWAAMQHGFAEYGMPALVLSDNGLAFSGRRRGGLSQLERELAACGIVAISSSVAHPQTCGKVERHHQTMKKWLAARDAATTLTGLQTLLDDYRAFYNSRPQKALDGATPLQRWAAKDPAGPQDEPIPRAGTATRSVSATGVVQIDGLSIHLGRRWGHGTATVFWQDNRYAVFVGNELARQLVVDRTVTRQRLNPANT